MKEQSNDTKLKHKYRVFQKSRPSLTRYILRYENIIAIKEICSDRVTLHNVYDTKHDPIDDLFTYLSEFKWISPKYIKAVLEEFVFQMFVHLFYQIVEPVSIK